MAVPDDSMGSLLDLRVPSAYRSMDQGKEMEAIQEP
jgi:hypothetical protein